MSVWLKDAELLPGAKTRGGSMVGGECIGTHHITVTKKGTAGTVNDILMRENFEPTLLLDPYENGRYQFLPADKSAYALEHRSGTPETNREGKIHVQIEWLWYSMSDDISKAPHFFDIWNDLIPWMEDLGIPSVWTFGSPFSNSRNPVTWKKAGHRGHRNAPYNSHVDGLAWKNPVWPSVDTSTPLAASTLEALHKFTSNISHRRTQAVAKQHRDDLRRARAQIDRVLNIPNK